MRAAPRAAPAAASAISNHNGVPPLHGILAARCRAADTIRSNVISYHNLLECLQNAQSVGPHRAANWLKDTSIYQLWPGDRPGGRHGSASTRPDCAS